MMRNDVARRVRAVGARLRSCPIRARRVPRWPSGTGPAGRSHSRSLWARGGCASGGQESERWRAGAGPPVWVSWGHVQAGGRRGGRRRQWHAWPWAAWSDLTSGFARVLQCLRVEAMFARPQSQCARLLWAHRVKPLQSQTDDKVKGWTPTEPERLSSRQCGAV
eukprot:6941198-Prymnesium_polylepis.1